MTTKTRCALLLLLLAGPGMPSTHARAADDAGFPRPLPVASQSPVMGVFGIPRAQGVGMLGHGNIRWDATVELASHFQGGEAGDEAIFFDGETARLALQARYGLNDDWNIGVEVPWVHHGPGFLDAFIIDWHDLWGFPQRGRDQAAEDELVYRYERDGATRFEIQSATSGLGDIVVSAQRRLWRGERSAGVLHTQLELPTGDAADLTGSGALDAAAGIELSRRWGRQWHSMLRAGAAYLGEGDLLPGLQRNWATYGGLDVVWRPLRPLSFRVQFDAHTSPYEHSALRELTDWTGLLTTGGTWHISRRAALDLAVAENVPNADVESDVSFLLRLRVSPGGGR